MGGDAGGSRLKAFIAGLGNFSIQYNFSCLSIAVAFMTSHWGKPTGAGEPADFPEPAWAKQALVGAVFAGSFVGMLMMGYIGDILGRRIGMMLTLSLVVAGAAASAFGSWDPSNVYAVICGARFLLGVGVGGIYPMAAATAAENNADDDKAANDDIVYDPRHAVQVAKAFFWQTPGAFAPYIVALALAQVPSSETTTSVQFRTMLGLGAIPATIVFLASALSSDSKGSSGSRAAAAHGSSGTADASSDEHDSSKRKEKAPAKAGPYAVIFSSPKHLATLVGTGGVWFLYDVSFYGTSIFTPQILASIFGSSEDLTTLAWQSLVVGLMGLPGIFSAVALLRPAPGQGGEEPEDWPYRWRVLPRGLDQAMSGWTARDLNVWGFVLMAACFTAMALAYQFYGSGGGATLKFALFCIIQFSLNWGPNPGTYVQPTQSFPQSIRTTTHGISAAAGKAGAVVGTFMYTPFKELAGFAAVMWLQAALSLLGCAASYYLLPKVEPLRLDKAGHAVPGGSGAEDVDGAAAGAAAGRGAKLASSKTGSKSAGGSRSKPGDDDDDSDKPLLDA